MSLLRERDAGVFDLILATQVQISKYSMTQTMKQKYYLLNNNLVNNIFVIFFTFVSGFK